MEECRNEMTLNKLLYDLINEHKNLFIIYSLIVLTLPIRDILMPKVVGNFYNSISKNENINYAFIILIAVVIIIQVINTFSEYIDTKVYPLIMIFVRDKIMKHIFEINKNNYNEINIGDIIAKIIKLPSIMYNHIDVIRSKIIPSIVTLTCILIYMFYIDWKLGLPMVVLLCVLAMSLYFSYSSCSSITVDRDKIHTKLMSDVDDILRNIMTVMSFDKIEEEFDRLGENDKLFIKHSEDSLNCSLKAKYINGPFIIGYIVYVCYYLFGKMKKKKMDSGQVITMVIISFTVINTMLSFLGNWEFFLIRDGIIKNSLEIFKDCKAEKIPYDKEAENKEGILFQNVDFAYISKGVKRPVFKDFNLNIELNKTTVIVGEIGAGKSTLISLLLKYQTPQSGEIFIKGVPYSKIPTETIRKNIMYVPQTPILLNRTVYENIIYGIHPAPSKEDVEAVMKEAGLVKFLEELPNGLDSSAGIHGGKLSGGQRQIVWLLKAILINPEIIIMDEPTASVDEKTKNIIHLLMQKIMKDKTVIMITHDSYLLKFADKKITLGPP